MTADRDKKLQKLKNLTQNLNSQLECSLAKLTTHTTQSTTTPITKTFRLNHLLVNILLKGVHKPIKTVMVLNQMLPEVTTWEEAQKAAIRCENTLYKTQASGGTLELPNLSTSNANTLTTTLIQQQQKQIDELKKQLDKALIRKQPTNFQSK